MWDPVLALSAVVPSVLLMVYFHRRDAYREPILDLWLVFLAGIAIVGPVLLVARPLEPFIAAIEPPLVHGTAAAFLQAAIPEELFKFVVLWWVARRRRAFDEPMDGVVYGVAASLGFATLENVLYVSNGGLAVAVTRALTAVPCHAFLGAIMGYFVGVAAFDPSRRKLGGALALLVPITLHGIYDAPLLTAGRLAELGISPQPWSVALLSIAPLVVVGEWIAAVRLSGHLRRRQLGEGAVVSRFERWSSYVLTAGGGVLASLGALVVLAGSWLVLVGRFQGESVGHLMAVGTVAGVTPALIGVALFLWGIRRLNES